MDLLKQIKSAQVVYLVVVSMLVMVLMVGTGVVESFEIDIFGVKAKAARNVHVEYLEKIIAKQQEQLIQCFGEL